VLKENPLTVKVYQVYLFNPQCLGQPVSQIIFLMKEFSSIGSVAFQKYCNIGIALWSYFARDMGAEKALRESISTKDCR
jgi:hypothetical protein